MADHDDSPKAKLVSGAEACTGNVIPVIHMTFPRTTKSTVGDGPMWHTGTRTVFPRACLTRYRSV